MGKPGHYAARCEDSSGRDLRADRRADESNPGKYHARFLRTTVGRDRPTRPWFRAQDRFPIQGENLRRNGRPTPSSTARKISPKTNPNIQKCLRGMNPLPK